ncbi:hypothetical protein GF361_04560 [Candidatus Woesearchaeota archaeon]|nr:hypothetical protein [Candidatus Woesearchaeota archaeon]
MASINKFKEIIRKNFLLLWRSKRTILTIFLGPLILISLLGFAFNNTGLNKVSIISYSEEYSELSNALIERLKENNFALLKAESEEECISNVKLGRNHVCMILPPDFNINENNELIIHIDKSKVNFVGTIINMISYNIKDESSVLSLNLTGVLLDRLKSAEELSKESMGLVSEIKDINIGLNEKVNNVLDGITELESVTNNLISKIDDLNSQTDVENSINDIIELVDEGDDLIGDIKKEGISHPKLEYIEDILEDIEDEARQLSEAGDVLNDLEEGLDQINKLKGELFSVMTSIKNELLRESGILDDVMSNLKETDSNVKSIKIKDPDKIVNPIVTDIRPIAPEKSYLTYIFPTLLVLILMFGGTLLSSTASIVEKRNSAFFRNFISPTNRAVFLAARYVADLIVVIIQLMIFTGISFAFIGMGIFSNISLVFALLAVASFFVLLGIMVGSIFNSEESGILFSMVITSIMLFFSNTILPLENMSNLIYKISKFNPFVLSESMLRKSTIYGMGVGSIWRELLLLFIWIVAVIGIISIVNKSNVKNIIEALKKRYEKIMHRIGKIIFVEE